MADGAEMDWKSGKITECVTLDEAMDRLEAGSLQIGTSIDLGDGVIAEYLDGVDRAALLARLVAHSRLITMAIEADQVSGVATPAVSVDSHAKALLDAIRNAR